MMASSVSLGRRPTVDGTAAWVSLLPVLLALSTLAGEATGLAPARRPGQRQRTAVCPPETDLLPCACLLRGNGVHIMCENSELEVVMSSMEALMKRVLRVEELHLVGNRIPVLPGRIFGSIQINKLFLTNNEMVSITRNAFAGLESTLEHLYISEPWLSDLPFDTLDNLANLRTCVIENTDIAEIPRLYSLSKLEFLKIDGSRVASIPSAAFRFMPNMKKVHIANSQLKKIDGNALEGLVYLKEVNFSNNVIDWIHPRAFRTLNTVEHLSLAGNRLSGAAMAVLATRELKGLKILDLSGNLIREFSKGTFVDMPTVKVIDARDNQISKIEHGAFFRLPALRRINLGGNLLEEFHADIFTESPNIEHLSIARNNLTFMAEMRYIARTLPNLRSLDVSENRLQIENTRIFHGHDKLEALKLGHNEIEVLHPDLFRDLPSLRELYLSNNFIQSDFDGKIWDLPELRVLDLSYNDLRKVDARLLEGVPQVTSLDLSFNVITDVAQNAFTDAVHMKNLNMSFNGIAKLPGDVFASLGELFELEMSFNELLALDSRLFKGLTSLEFLHLTHNQIVTIDVTAFKNVSKLRYLDLSANLIQDIPTETLGKLTSLEVLKLHRNAINQLHDDFFLGLGTVEHLDLSSNHIQSLGQTAFRDLSTLRDLDLSVNYIQNLHPDMFSTTKQLEKLNISHNYVADLGHHTFDNVKRLRILDLTNNSLTELGEVVKGLSSLQGLFLSDNYVSELKNTSFRDVPSLNVLRFKNNGLQTFESGTFHNMNSLIILDLQDNHLVELNPDSFASMRSLEELKISRNQISIVKDFAFSDLRSLRSLELQDNVITEMGAHAFQGMPSMKFMNLSRNGFQEIPEDALAMLRSLDVLDLSWNYILEVKDSSFRRLEWLTVLMLHDNDLCHLSEESFARQRALRVLTLHNNQLRRLHLHALGNTINGLSLLDMSGNPFQCDCDLVWLREYLLEDPTEGRGPRTTILGESMRGVPVCAAPSQYQGLPITEVPVSAFLCEGRPIGGPKKEACVPRFLDPLLLTPNQAGAPPNPGAINTLLQLANLSEAATGASYLDYNNPILVHDLPGLVSSTTATTSTTISTTTTTTTPATAAVSASNPTVALSTTQQVAAASGLHTVTGDTPTIYAGSSSSSAGPTDAPQQTTTEAGFLGGLRLPTLPNLLESISSLRLPHVGLNLDWGAFPSIGRQESAAVSKFGPVEGHKPMKGPDDKQPIWIDGPTSPHPLFPPPPPARGSTVHPTPPSAAPDRQPGAGSRPRPFAGQEEGRGQGSGRPRPFAGQGEGHGQAPGRPRPVISHDEGRGQALEGPQVPLRGPGLPFRFPEGQGERLRPGLPGVVVPVRRPVNVWGERAPPGSSPGSKPVLPAVAHAGPGPNSGTPFLPGLSTHQPGHGAHGRPAIIAAHHSSPSPLLTSTLLSNSQGPSTKPPGRFPLITVPPGSKGPQRGKTGSQGGEGSPKGKPQWSTPEMIHPDSGVSHYQPGEPFLPYRPPDPRHPITVVQPPHISLPQQGSRYAPFLPTPVRPPTPSDMSPSETQAVDGNSLVPRNTDDNPTTPTAAPPPPSSSPQGDQGIRPLLGQPPRDQGIKPLTDQPPRDQGIKPLTDQPPRDQGIKPFLDQPPRDQGIRPLPDQPPRDQDTKQTSSSTVLSRPPLPSSATSQSRPQATGQLDIVSSFKYPAQQHRPRAPPSQPTTPRHRQTTSSTLLPPYSSHVEASSEVSPATSSTLTTSSVYPQTSPYTPPSLADDSGEGEEEEEPKHSLGDLLHLLYAAEEEVQRETQEGDGDQPHADQADQSQTPSSAAALTLPALLPTPEPPPPPHSSTTTTTTFSSTTTTSQSSTPSSTSTEQPSTTSDRQSNRHNLPASIFPPKLGQGVHLLKDVPVRDEAQSHPPADPSSAPRHDGPHHPAHPQPNDLSSSRNPMQERRPTTNTPAPPTRTPAGAYPNTTWAPTSARVRPGPTAHTSGRPDPAGAPSPSRARPGVVLPVDKPDSPPAGARRRPATNSTYISPSRSIGRGGFPTIERVYQPGQTSPDAHTVAVQGIDLPGDAGNVFSNASDDQPIREAEFETSQVNAIDWYYNNYFREYSSLPVGGNRPPSAASTHTPTCSAFFIYLAIMIHNHALW